MIAKEGRMNYIGVDPGNDGGLALIDKFGKAVEYQKMPDVAGIDKFFRDAYVSCSLDIICIFEEHKGGKAGITSAAAHKSAGRYLGIIQAMCQVYSIKMVCITPQEWKAHFKLINRTLKGQVKPSDKVKREAAKQASIALCKQHFPCINLKATPRCTTEHDGIAESLLLAEFGRRLMLI
jgi:hypothetical protein